MYHPVPVYTRKYKSLNIPSLPQVQRGDAKITVTVIQYQLTHAHVNTSEKQKFQHLLINILFYTSFSFNVKYNNTDKVLLLDKVQISYDICTKYYMNDICTTGTGH